MAREKNSEVESTTQRRHAVMVVLPPELYSQLRAQAASEYRTLSNLVAKIVVEATGFQASPPDDEK
jgi:hypothetical protein